MKRVPKILQLPVIIEWRRPFSFKPQLSQELDFLLGSITAEGRIVKEFSEPRLFVKSRLRFLFHKLEFLRVPNCEI